MELHFACIQGSLEPPILGGWSKVLSGPAGPKRRWGTSCAAAMARMDVWVACTMRIRRISTGPGAVAARSSRRRQIARHSWVAGLAEEVAVPREWEGGPGGGEGELIQAMASPAEALASSSNSSRNVNPYDGAWVAMVPAVDGSVRPQFHAALNWVRGSQLPDGSWAADWRMFNLHDRLVCTLACVLALATWSRAKDAVTRGCTFISTHLNELAIEAEEVDTTLGFEIVLCALLERAEVLRLELPYHAPVMAILRSQRDRKLRQIPLLESCWQSPLLKSLEGLEKLPRLDCWKRLLQVPAPVAAGDMLFTMSASSCVSLADADGNSLQHLDRLVDEVNWQLPQLPQVDAVERLWVVDRLHHLGIARYCQLEIRDFLNTSTEKSRISSWQ